MTMLTNEQIQEALVAYLKSKTAVTNLLVDTDGTSLGATEIREDQWQGTEFSYPNIRVRMVNNNPVGDSDQCNASSFQVSIMTYSELASSHQSENISGIISTSLNAKTFEQGNLSIFLRVINLIPAVRSDRNVWRAECLMQGVATKIS